MPRTAPNGKNASERDISGTGGSMSHWKLAPGEEGEDLEDEDEDFEDDEDEDDDDDEDEDFDDEDDDDEE